MKIVKSIAALAGIGLLVSACAAQSPTSEPTSSGSGEVETATIRIVTLPKNLSTAQLALAQQEGFFEEQGLEVEFIEGAPPTYPSLLTTGQVEVAQGGADALLLARQGGIPLVSIGTASIIEGDPDEFPIQILVAPDSEVQEASDLEGKVLGVDTLGQLPQMLATSTLAENGADTSQIQFQEVPRQNMLTSLQDGTIDAVVALEPLLTQGIDQGFEVLYSVAESEEVQGLPLAGYWVTEQWAKDNPELVERFHAAVQEAQALAESDPDALHAVLPTYTDYTEEEAQTLHMYHYYDAETMGSIDDGWNTWVEILTAAGTLTQEPDLDAIRVMD